MMKFKTEYPKWIAARLLFIITILCLASACTASLTSDTQISTPTPSASVPNFDHIVIITFENKDYNSVIGNLFLPNYNWWQENIHY